jgi:hypothetical protein
VSFRASHIAVASILAMWVLSALGLWASMNAPLSVYSIALLCIVISGGIGLALPLLELGRDQ